MTANEINTKAKEYCDTEYRTTETLWNYQKGNYYHDKNMALSSLHRCLGIVQFVQTCGVEYEEVAWYDDLREKYYENFLDT